MSVKGDFRMSVHEIKVSINYKPTARQTRHDTGGIPRHLNDSSSHASTSSTHYISVVTLPVRYKRHCETNVDNDLTCSEILKTGNTGWPTTQLCNYIRNCSGTVVRLVRWSLTSPFSGNMAISETKGQGWRAIPTKWRKAGFPLSFDIVIKGLFKDFQAPSNFIFKDQFSTEVYSKSSRTAIFNVHLCDDGTVIRW